MMFCARSAWAASGQLRFGAARWDGTMVPPSVHVLGWVRVVAWVGMLWAKVLAANHADGDGGGAFGRRSPCWGRHLRAPPTIAWGLWAKAWSSSWKDDGSVNGVVTSLEALLLETQLSLGSRRLREVTTMCMRVSYKGVDKLKLWRLAVMVTTRGCFMAVSLAACSGPRRLELLSGCQSVWHNVRGQHLRQRQHGTTRLAADGGGWLSYAVVTPAWFIVERWRKRQLWFATMMAEAT